MGRARFGDELVDLGLASTQIAMTGSCKTTRIRIYDDYKLLHCITVDFDTLPHVIIVLLSSSHPQIHGIIYATLGSNQSGYCILYPWLHAKLPPGTTTGEVASRDNHYAEKRSPPSG